MIANDIETVGLFCDTVKVRVVQASARIAVQMPKGSAVLNEKTAVSTAFLLHSLTQTISIMASDRISSRGVLLTY